MDSNDEYYLQNYWYIDNNLSLKFILRQYNKSNLYNIIKYECSIICLILILTFGSNFFWEITFGMQLLICFRKATLSMQWFEQGDLRHLFTEHYIKAPWESLLKSNLCLCMLSPFVAMRSCIRSFCMSNSSYVYSLVETIIFASLLY